MFLSRLFNAAALAACMSNALAILMAALGKHNERSGSGFQGSY